VRQDVVGCQHEGEPSVDRALTSGPVRSTARRS
jgi:hypothetical protein